jgi:Na+-translocating ferredoxin:NAD+ oxidoreductase RnfG subunit
MKNKKVLLLGIALVLFAFVAGVLFAETVWRLQGEIVKSDTFETIRAFDMVYTTQYNNVAVYAAKQDIRQRLGFPSNSDTRTVNGVNQRIVWTSETRE